MIELLRAHRIVGSIPRPDRVGGEVLVHAVFHAFFSEPRHLWSVAYCCASDGTLYPLAAEAGSSEDAPDAAVAKTRAEVQCAAWMGKVTRSLDVFNGCLACGLVEMPGAT